MTSTPRQRPAPAQRADAGRAAADDLRRMVLLLETAEVLEQRARRTRDVAQVPVLLRRAEHRRREAARLKERLEKTPDSQQAFSPVSPPGQPAR
ncbi:MAG: hypothetical protein ACXVGF_21335 [Blastococcus sp.]